MNPNPDSDDFYERLGIASSADRDAITKAYRAAMLRYHPDRHAGADAATQALLDDQTKKITEAYTTLSDEDKRAEYDSQRNQKKSSTASSSESASRARPHPRPRPAPHRKRSPSPPFTSVFNPPSRFIFDAAVFIEILQEDLKRYYVVPMVICPEEGKTLFDSIRELYSKATLQEKRDLLAQSLYIDFFIQNYSRNLRSYREDNYLQLLNKFTEARDSFLSWVYEKIALMLVSHELPLNFIDTVFSISLREERRRVFKDDLHHTLSNDLVANINRFLENGRDYIVRSILKKQPTLLAIYLNDLASVSITVVWSIWNYLDAQSLVERIPIETYQNALKKTYHYFQVRDLSASQEEDRFFAFYEFLYKKFLRHDDALLVIIGNFILALDAQANADLQCGIRNFSQLCPREKQEKLNLLKGLLLKDPKAIVALNQLVEPIQPADPGVSAPPKCVLL